MRYLLIALAMILVFAVPAFAADPVTDEVDVEVTVGSFLTFDITNTVAIAFSITLYSQFGVEQTDDVGINYDLQTNEPWSVDGIIYDDGTHDGEANDWGGTGWVLKVNDYTLNEASSTQVDSGLTGVSRTGSNYSVKVTIPVVPADIYDCAISLTASTS